MRSSHQSPLPALDLVTPYHPSPCHDDISVTYTAFLGSSYGVAAAFNLAIAAAWLVRRTAADVGRKVPPAQAAKSAP
eukprot:6178054-Pleurochrysis_carterae.AAC.1